MVEYIYLIQEREFINAKKEIYKPGRTAQENGKRFASYPKDSKLLLQIACKDCLMTENIILKQFKEKYKQRKDIGREYFEGNSEEMMNDIMTIVMTTKLTQNKELKNILIDACKKSIYENIHNIFDNDKNIGEMSILHDDGFDNEELRINKIKIVEGHDNKETLIEIINYIQKEYTQMKYWVIVCDNLNVIKYDSDNEKYTETSENIKQLIIDILKNDKNYHCFQMEQLREYYNKKSYHLVITKIDHIKNGNKECDILLKFSEPVHFPINHKNDEKLIEKFRIVNDKTLYTCKRKFKSRIITKVTENKKYNIVEIIFDKPIIIISDKIVSDIYLKFIHKNEDYTPSLDNNDIFTMDYRLNKMMLNDNYTTMITLTDDNKYVELYVIKSMSYVCPYKKLCTMVSKINTI